MLARNLVFLDASNGLLVVPLIQRSTCWTLRETRGNTAGRALPGPPDYRYALSRYDDLFLSEINCVHRLDFLPDWQ
jgi:hypothetical protein